MTLALVVTVIEHVGRSELGPEVSVKLIFRFKLAKKH